MLRELNWETVGLMRDGRIRLAFEHALKTAVVDVDERPNDKTAREVTLTLKLKPKADQDGHLIDMSTEATVACKTPKMLIAGEQMGVKYGGKAYYNDLAEDNPNQRTLDEQIGQDGWDNTKQEGESE